MSITLLPLDARIPDWNFEDLIDRDCPICNSATKDKAYERPDGLIICICKKCNTKYVSPCPSQEQLNAFYRNYDETHIRTPLTDKKTLIKLYDSINSFDDLRIKELSSLMKFKDSKVLDIGFGRAKFLYNLKKLGVIPYGIDLDSSAINLAKYLGLNVLKGDVFDLSSQAEYDLITMLDFVEHPINSFDIIKKSSDVLKEDGFIAIWTPNGENTHFDKQLITFRVDLEHMQYFTVDTCYYIASELNLRIVHLETLGYPSLKDIEKTNRKNESIANRIKNIIRFFPGFEIIKSWKNKLLKKTGNERYGSYHLFCIMQKHSPEI